MNLNTKEVPLPIQFPLSKRVFDLVITLLLLLLLFPLMLIIVIAFGIESLFFPNARGPLLYSETRYTAGKPFTFYKFRIFKKAAIQKARNGGGTVHTKQLEHTPNALTYTGCFLKKVYMDELPQLINVLKGDMALVGPRPTNIENMKNQLRKKQYSKFLPRAGITGFFQSHKGIEMNGRQNDYDMRYIEFVKNNPWWKIIIYDLKILLISIKTILRAEGI